MPAAPLLDHLAIGVSAWEDAYPRFARDLGGRWSHGGSAGPFAPYQLIYRHGMKLEFIAPDGADGFMHRFLDQHGAGPHHITFKVPSLDDALAAVAELGIGILGGRTSMPYWHEAFLHPKACGMGTLIQLVEADEEVMANLLADSPTPPGFPVAQGEQQGVAWIGLTARSLTGARRLFADVLAGSVDDEGAGWLSLGWGPGRSLLIREGDAAPGGAQLWAGAPELGVSHVVVGDEGCTLGTSGVERAALTLLPRDPGTVVPVWTTR